MEPKSSPSSLSSSTAAASTTASAAASTATSTAAPAAASTATALTTASAAASTAASTAAAAAASAASGAATEALPGMIQSTPGSGTPAASLGGDGDLEMSKADRQMSDRVELTSAEQQMFATLVGTVSKFGLKTQLRVAGGWVRDKLLGKTSLDIDISLDDMPGREFAEKVNEYLESHGEVARGVGVIRSNPEQSKHLETATMMIHGQWIDLVNLRAESYADEGSRIPSSVEFGTPEEDAMRRDLTINSLFYNITTGEVEDFTGKGVEDLKQGVIRTPLLPMQTFLDDPLRVLRAVRFTARFGFKVDPALVEAASSAEVRTALGSKISRERVGKEVLGMLKGRDPLLAVDWLSSLGLFSTVFSLPPGFGAPAGENGGASRGEFGSTEAEQGGLKALATVQRLRSAAPAAFVGSPSDSGEDLLVSTLLAAILLPLRHAKYLDHKQKEIPVCQFVVRESLKLKASLADTVSTLHEYSEAFRKVVPLLTQEAELQNVRRGTLHEPEASTNNEGSADQAETSASLLGELGVQGNESATAEGFGSHPRVLAGKILRKAKASWRSSLLLCAVLGPIGSGGREMSGGGHEVSGVGDEMTGGGGGMSGVGEALASTSVEVGSKRFRTGEGSGAYDEGGRCTEGVPNVKESSVVLGLQDEWEQQCVRAAERIVELGLEGVWEQKPLVNGREIISCLPLGKGSSLTGLWAERAMEWQLANPKGTAEGCKSWLIQQKGIQSPTTT